MWYSKVWVPQNSYLSTVLEKTTRSVSNRKHLSFLFTPQFWFPFLLDFRGCHQGCSDLCCFWAKGVDEGGECFPRSQRKRVTGSGTWGPKYLFKPESEGQRRTPPGTSISSQACAAGVLSCCCFCFDSSPGLGQSPSVTHILALAWLWPFFIFNFFFFFFNEFPLVFPDTVRGWNKSVIVSKFPGPVQGQQPVV